MKKLIGEKLQEIELDEKVRIVYAFESGSRAWGFPSADSDYDVRFIYVRPLDWYLSIFPKRDVIERPINDALDINGWDLKKALQLLVKSNPPLLEWLGSPIVYLEETDVASQMRKFGQIFYSPVASLFHYLHMARGNFRDYLQGETVWVKKYFYVLRPLLAMNWIEQNLGVVPTDFTVVVDHLVMEPMLRDAIDRLLAEKRAGAELDRGPRIEPISQYIESELARWDNQSIQHEKKELPYDRVDELFRGTLLSTQTRRWPRD